MSISSSIREEWEAIFSGHFVPYHKLAVMVALLTSIFFSLFFSHDVVFEAPIAVIDLDQSRWSADFIEKVNASPYMSVKKVLHSPADPLELTRGDAVQGVLYLPKGVQAAAIRGERTVQLGFFADDSNTAQNGEIYSQLQEITAELGGEIASSRTSGVASLGLNAQAAEAAATPLRMAFRYLTNPTGQAATGTVINFLFFFSMMFHGLSSLMVIGRLRATRAWDAKVMTGSVFALLARAVPYALIFTAVLSTAIAVFVLFGQLRFAGNSFLFLPSLFLCACANTWAAMLLSWGCGNPGEGASRMIWLVPPGFILGGATMATGFAHGWAHALSFGVPLVWQFNFWRDHGLKGVDFGGSLALYGCFILYLVALAALVAIRFWCEEARRAKEVRAIWKELGGAEEAAR